MNNIINYTLSKELGGNSCNKNKIISVTRGGRMSGTGIGSSGGVSLNDLNQTISKYQNNYNIIDTYHFTRKISTILRENEFDLSKTNINKIFCSQWLDDVSVVLGTKCNKIVVLNTNTSKYCLMNPLKSHEQSVQIAQNCGIHSISINPSRTLMATGAENVNDIGVYRLPNFEPVCVGYSAHSNWIFDTAWIDDTHVVSGSGDSKLALWTIDDITTERPSTSHNTKSIDNTPPNHDQEEDVNYLINNKRRRINVAGKYDDSCNQYKYKKATKVVTCKKGKRVRAIVYNQRRDEVAALAMNATFHVFNAKRFEQTSFKRLSIHKENVCLTTSTDNSIYAIGSASYVQILISDTLKSLLPAIFIKKDIGVRSLNFRNYILSIGTGIGTVMFYDLRALKFIESEKEDKYKLQTKGGWILRNESYYDYLSYTNNTDHIHAIYSHCYDPSGTKLFTAGGPLTVGLYGHYASVWR